MSRHGGGAVAGVGGALGHVRSEGGSEKEMENQGEGCNISKDSASIGLPKPKLEKYSQKESVEAR